MLFMFIAVIVLAMITGAFDGWQCSSDFNNFCFVSDDAFEG